MIRYFKRLKPPKIDREEIREKILLIKAQSHNEYKETLMMLRLLYKSAKTKEEKQFILQQVADIFKIGIVLVIAALPAGTVAIAFIEVGFRKFNRTILPTSFSDEFEAEHKKRNQTTENSTTTSKNENNS